MMIHARPQSGTRPLRCGRLFIPAASWALPALAMAGSGMERAHVAAAPIETSLSDTAIHSDEPPEREPVAAGRVSILVNDNATGANDGLSWTDA